MALPQLSTSTPLTKSDATQAPSTAGLTAAVGLGSLLVIPAAVLQPVAVHEVGPGAGPEQVLAGQAWVAQHLVAFHVSNLLIVLGLFGLAWFVRGVGRRARGRLAAVGSGLAVVGLVAAAVANAVISSVRVALVMPGLDSQQSTAALLTLTEGWYLSTFFVPYLLLVPLGTLLLMVGLVVTRTVPWWASAGLLPLAAIPFSPTPTAVLVLAGGVLLVAALRSPRSRDRLG